MARGYISIQEWMVTELQLTGDELLIYAIVYGFSQDGDGQCWSSLDYFTRWTGKSRRTVIDNIVSLVNKGLINKIPRPGTTSALKINANFSDIIKHYDNIVNSETSAETALPQCNNCTTTRAETAPPPVQKLHGGVQKLHGTRAKTAHNNKKIIKKIIGADFVEPLSGSQNAAIAKNVNDGDLPSTFLEKDAGLSQTEGLDKQVSLISDDEQKRLDEAKAKIRSSSWYKESEDMSYKRAGRRTPRKLSPWEVKYA